MNPTQTPAQFLAAQFLAAYEEAEKTGKQIEEIARLDVLATVARQVLADVAQEEERAARVPAWRHAADAHTTCEIARMAEYEIARLPESADVWTVDVCDYVTACVHAFEAAHLATEWGEEGADWMEETEKHWRAYTAAHRPPWRNEDAEREREAETFRAALRAAGYLATGFSGCVEIRNRDTGSAVLTMECHGDGTCDVENHDAGRSEPNVPIATVLTYARLMVRA
jgi:hypothetical protein